MKKFDKIINEKTEVLNEMLSPTVYKSGMEAMQAVINMVNSGNIQALRRVVSIGERGTGADADPE